jgi:serine/threonine-protein kinase
MAKISLSQKELMDLLVSKQFLEAGQLSDCVQTQKKAQELGLKQSVLDIAVQKGYLTKEKRDEFIRTAASMSEDKPPIAIPGYEIESKIGKGGMGVVYKAKQISLDRVVAVKILAKRLSNDEVFVQRFLREARSAAKIDHPNVVRAIDAGKIGDTFFFVMEYVAGQTLRARLDTGGAVSQEEALDITEKVTEALIHADALGIVHRDIKPDNIMLTPDGNVKLSDLGLAKEVFDSSVTMTGNVVGTPYYMSPEQIEGKPDVDIRSDIYSLGATLYQMLTNEYPFAATTPTAVIAKHLNEKRPDASAKNAAISKPVSLLVKKMMARDRTMRPKDALELKNLIGKTREGIRLALGLPLERQPGKPMAEELAAAIEKKSAFPLVPVIGGAALCLILALVVILLATRGKEETPADEKTAAVEKTAPEPKAEPTRPPKPETVTEEPAAPPAEPATAAKAEQPKEPAPAPAAPSASAKPPAPSRPPVRSMSSLRMQFESRRRYSEVTRAKQKYAKDPLRFIAECEAFIAKYPDTRSAERAKEEIALANGSIATMFATAQRQAGQQLAAGNYRGGEQKYLHFLTYVPKDPWLKRAEAELARVRASARKAYETERKKADDLMAAGKSSEAYELMLDLIDKTTVESAKQAAGTLRSLDRTQRKIEETRRKQEEMLAKARSQAFEDFDTGGLSGVSTAYEGLLRDSRFSFARDSLEREAKTLEKIGRVLKKAEDKAATRIGKEMTVHGIAGKIVRVEKGSITVEAGGAQFSEKIAKLKSAEILDLAGVSTKIDSIEAAIVHVSCGEYPTARRMLDRLSKAGDDVTAPMAILTEIQGRTGETKATEPASSPGAPARAASVKPGQIPGFVVETSLGVSAYSYKGTYAFDNSSELNDWVKEASSQDPWTVAHGSLTSKGGYGRLRNRIEFVGDITVEAELDSNSNFALKIGEYSFIWYPVYGSDPTAKKIKVLKSGIRIVPERQTYDPRPGTVKMKWERKGTKLTWYLGDRRILMTNDSGKLSKTSMLAIESQPHTSFRRTGSGPILRIHQLSFYGKIEPAWLRSQRP